MSEAKKENVHHLENAQSSQSEEKSLEAGGRGEGGNELQHVNTIQNTVRIQHHWRTFLGRTQNA